jgi:hypothetical protein
MKKGYCSDELSREGWFHRQKRVEKKSRNSEK